MSIQTSNNRPSLVTAIAIMTLISGIVNIFWGLVATLTVMATLVGVICTPFTALPTILGIFEIIYAAKLLGNPPQPVRPATTLAIFEIACILAGNAFSMIVGILALVFYNDLVVKAYFDEINHPGAAVPPAPALREPQPAPEAPAEPGQPDEPQIPPPGPRKVA